MVEHALGEGLASGVGPQVGGEAEGLVDGQVGLDDKHGGARGLSLLEHVTSPPVQHSVDTSDSVLRALNLDLVDGLQQPGLGCEHAGVQDPPGGGNDLTTTAMDGISVKCHIVQAKPARPPFKLNPKIPKGYLFPKYSYS